jgi:hypothetical protein
MDRLRARTWLLALLAAFTLGGCSASPAPTPPDLRPAIAAPVKPIDALPKHITIPSIGVDAAVEGIGLNSSNQFDLAPLDARPQNVGWYLYGPPPGSPGPAVLMSHVDMNGKQGAFFHLKNVKVGDKIVVSRGGGPSLTFHVTKTLLWPKAKFSDLHLYDPTPDAQLRLATCSGVLDRTAHSYLSNFLVWAVLDK